jgi:hypothetical protein
MEHVGRERDPAAVKFTGPLRVDLQFLAMSSFRMKVVR